MADTKRHRLQEQKNYAFMSFMSSVNRTSFESKSFRFVSSAQSVTLVLGER